MKRKILKGLKSYQYEHSFDKKSIGYFKILQISTGIMWQDHPWTIMRASELFKWVESGEYESIMKKYNAAPVGCVLKPGK
ncbi:hypothetical protein AN618_01390 [Fervidicola ferrireducens]|uniref:Uncharacterized protein n=1 Tax=Fervidicola ferrireducens TaxID=520764 RepID=A0A140LE26_9FIRM|nr:hypothetical protein [Fervidicola ferrireducens]KXG78801.1 hypothetical protein AN618_01390 [Fervidicola ferrireducens]